MTRRTPLVVAVRLRWIALGLAVPMPAVGQDVSIRGPLRPLADHPAPVIPAPALPALLTEPAPTIGLFQSAGIAAGLADEVATARGILRLGLSDARGAYRRPFDPDRAGVVSVRGAGWQRVSRRVAAWGRVVVEDGGRDPTGYTVYGTPYGSDPLILADTATSKLHRARAALEGALGWSGGGWRVGVAAGIGVTDDGTRDASFIRTNRMSLPAVQLSVGRTLFGVTTVLHGRWTGGSETMLLRSEPGVSRAWFLTGFEEPLPLDITPAPPAALFRRTQKDAYAGGVAFAGRLLGRPWVLSVARTYRRDIHFSEVVQDPPSDTWVADGWTITAAHQRGLPLGLTGTFALDASRLVGDVTLVSVEGVVTRVRETMLETSLDLRGAPGRIQPALRLGLAMSRRQLDDFLRRAGAALTVWRPSAVAEVAYTLGGTSVALSGGVAGAGPYATLINPTLMGPVYQRFIAPTWSRDATKATTLLGSLTVRQTMSSRVALLGQAGITALSPRGTPVLASPDGRYREWRVGIGVVGSR
jgi:hypothetical protein